ncbi:hypothetical protein QTQ03_19375 [Micromonospora sp. WMMA1363]|uniref:hypothetical protein n=1 Tax=Micromonospora sp. WMMA1363 TaxID=3053985 RepID=UPI00259C8563|nr:hypothetical protein [Micromonospora sp. WMMA1363]MDM4721645.1 hypothetical protein [Micromonospora sp. WMMA1363]
MPPTGRGYGANRGPARIRAAADQASLYDMESHLVVLLPLAGLWLAAGTLADGLPRATHARVLRRRADHVLALTLTGLVLTAVVLFAGLSGAGSTPADRATAAVALAAAPALLVAACTVNRVRRLRAGARAFATAPRTPAPHGLRAAAAHPLLGLPIQLTGLAILPGLASPLIPDVLTGPAITVGALGVTAIGVRHALRHSRLAERAGPPARASTRTASALHV